MRKNSLLILNLIVNATEREVNTNYWRIAQIYIPDKQCRASTSMSPNQVEKYFKLVNNLYKFSHSNA